jgi:serine/threonine-protein kinase
MVTAFQAYVAPEHIQGLPCTAASDVFSMGVIFYELCSGRHPFVHGTAREDQALAQVLQNIVRETPALLAKLVPGVPDHLDHVLQQALNKEPALRPGDAGALRRLMAQASAGQIGAGVLPTLQHQAVAAISDPDATVRLFPPRKTEPKK